MDFPKYYIYKLTFQSGATYIGQHTQKTENDKYITSSKYFKEHRKTDPLIKREILLYVKDKETLDIMETLCIRGDMCNNEKNVNGNYGNWEYRFNFKGRHHTDEFKQNTKKQMEEMWKNPEHRKHMLLVHLGRKNTTETKEKMSKAASKSWTDERRQSAVNSGHYSHAHSAKTKEFLSSLQKGRTRIHNDKIEKMVRNPETYLKQGWKLGKLPVSDKARENMSKAAKKRPCNTIGKIKIHKGEIGKFIKKEELQIWLDNGWEKGVSDKQAERLRKIARRK